MTTDELIEILKTFDAGTLSRTAAVEAMVARGELRDEAEFAMALHTGASKSDVLD